MMMSTLVRRLKKPSTMKIGSAMPTQTIGWYRRGPRGTTLRMRRSSEMSWPIEVR